MMSSSSNSKLTFPIYFGGHLNNTREKKFLAFGKILSVITEYRAA
jgi:hypothetical protein